MKELPSENTVNIGCSLTLLNTALLMFTWKDIHTQRKVFPGL